jgi:anti-sigma B factor antagonist
MGIRGWIVGIECLPWRDKGNRMLLEIRETGQPRAFRLIGELDISNAGTLGTVLDREVEKQGDISLDLSELKFIDSSGIRVLLQAVDRLNGRGKLLLLSPTDSVRHILSLMGLDDREAFRVIDQHDQGP